MMGATPELLAAPRRPRWGHQTSLWQVREPAFWLFAGLIVALTILQITYLAGYPGTSVGSLMLSVVLLALFAAPIFFLVYRLDPYEREPLSLLLGAVAWGGFASVTMAQISQAGWDPLVADLLGDNFLDWRSALLAPPTEEILKGLGVVLLYLIARTEFDDLLDGIIYGVMVGLGFHVIEDLGHFMATFGGTIDGVLQGFFQRVIGAGIYFHLAWSGLVGLGVAYFVTRREEETLGRRLLVAGGCLLVAMVGHSLLGSPILWFGPDALETFGDHLQFVAAMTFRGIPFVALVVVLIVLARRREHRWLRVALATEAGFEGLHQDELVTLENPKLRRGARRRMGASFGPVAAKALGHLQRAHIELAMIRTRVDEDDHPDLVRQREYIQNLRAWLVQNTGHRGSTLAWNFPTGAQGPPGGPPPPA